MSLAIRWGEREDPNGGFIYFDAVKSYSQDYSGKVTQHPIDSGASITDHFVKNNSRFTVSAVITGVDISTGTYLIQDLAGLSPYNSNEAPNAVSVNSTDNSVLSKLIPNSIGQFLSDSTPDVIMDGSRADLLDTIRDAMIGLTSGTILNEQTGQFDSNIQLVRLYEYRGTLINRILNNLVITNIRFNEDANTGYALYCDITFEQVTFAFLKKTDIPKDVQQPVKKKASTKKSIGKCDSTVKDTTATDNTDPQGKKDAVDSSVEDVDPLRTVPEL